MMVRERALVFECDGDSLVGVLAQPEKPAAIGVLIVVGGPQYRAGSHRQFVHLARSLASCGFASLRFDYRGMGDSEGAMRTFEHVERDIAAASEALRMNCPAVQQVAGFGLCDAASALLIAAGRGANLSALLLANPWARRDQSLNAAVVQHYYADRLRSSVFWRDLLAGRIPVRARAAEALQRMARLIADRRSNTGQTKNGDFIESMRVGWQRALPTLLLLSEHDITAREFDDTRAADPRWLRTDAGLGEVRLLKTDHTLSTPGAKIHAAEACSGFLATLTIQLHELSG